MKHFPRFYFQNYERLPDICIFDREESDACSVIARVYDVKVAQKIVDALNGADQKNGG